MYGGIQPLFYKYKKIVCMFERSTTVTNTMRLYTFHVNKLIHNKSNPKIQYTPPLSYFKHNIS